MVSRIKWNGNQVAGTQFTQLDQNEHNFYSRHLVLMWYHLLSHPPQTFGQQNFSQRHREQNATWPSLVLSLSLLFPILLFQVGERMSSTRNRSKLVFPPTKGKRIDGSSLVDHVRHLNTPSIPKSLWKGISTKFLAIAVVGLCQWTQFSSH